MTADLLAAFAGAPERSGLFLDFDGVLADIAPTHDGARIRPGAGELLTGLRPRLGRLAVLTGRPIDYVDAMIPPTVDVVGLYGLEWRLDGERGSVAEAEGWRSGIAEVADAAAEVFGSAAVERKGLSLTLHYRDNGNDRTDMEVWVRERADATGLESRSAKRSFELHPPLHLDKGTALLEMAAGLDPVAYMGDDVGDLPAFDALDTLGRAGVATWRVAVTSSEAPEILLERADLVVDGPSGAEHLLAGLVARTAAES